MLLILNLILIIIINKTYVYSIQDSDIILLPAWNPASAKEIRFTVMYYLVLHTQSINQDLLGFV